MRITHSFVRRWCAVLAGLGLILTLAACGGGGSGSASGTPLLGTGSTSSTTSGSTTTTTDTATVAVALSSSTVTAGAPATMTITVTNKAGSPLSGLVVALSTKSSLGVFSPASVLTDGNGKATAVLSPAASVTSGADTAVATVSYLGASYSGSQGFQTSATNVTIASFTADTTQLSAYGQANLTVKLSGTTPTIPVGLSLTSSCVAAGKGTLTPTTQTTSTGTATFTFRDNGCGAIASSDTETISVSGTTQTQTLTIPVTTPTVSSIAFKSASPTQIYVAGSGLGQSSTVTFQVNDSSGNGLPGQAVQLYLSTTSGGLLLNSTANVTSASPLSVQSDSNGQVVAHVNSGTLPTPVSVVAKLTLPGGTVVSAASSSLSVAIGLPSEQNFSLAVSTFNIEGMDIDGVNTSLTIHAADRMGNPVPDGTPINFISPFGGQVLANEVTSGQAAGSFATAASTFTSQSPRPANGRVTILAYTLGEESFIDQNQNNVWDSGEPIELLGSPFVSRNYTSAYDASVDQGISGLGGSASCAATATMPSSSLLPSATDPAVPNQAGTCVLPTASGGTLPQVYVRRAVQVVLSHSSAQPYWGTSWPAGLSIYMASAASCTAAPVSLITGYNATVPVTSNSSSFYPFGNVKGSQMTIYNPGQIKGTFYFTLADTNSVAFNPMPARTTIAATATDQLTATIAAGSPVINTTSPTGVAVNYVFATPTVLGTAQTTTGTITFNFTSPSGLVSQASINLDVTPVPAAPATYAPSGTLCNP